MNSEQPPGRPEEGPDKEKEKRTIDHAIAGYKNGQDVIRFLDTKNGVVTTLCVAVMGFEIQAVKTLIGLPTLQKNAMLEAIHPWMLAVVTVLAIAGLVAPVVVLTCCVRSVLARPPKTSAPMRSTILFPYHSGSLEDRVAVATCYDALLRGLSFSEIVAEYKVQLTAIGEILFQKIYWNRAAVYAFLAQLTLVALAATLFVFGSYPSADASGRPAPDTPFDRHPRASKQTNSATIP